MPIFLVGESIPEVWEGSILELLDKGRRIPTQYDKEGDPPSWDDTAMLVVDNPMGDVRIHRWFPGGLVELESYRQEVVDGIHDHWIDPSAGSWQYSYHERLFDYTVPTKESNDQIDYIVRTLKDCPYSRRAQAVLWKAWDDQGISDPCCLQRLHCRIVDGKLVMNTHMRSNDALRAAFMNMYAFTDLQREIADRLGVPVGRYIHIADSYHIYGSCSKDVHNFKSYLLNRKDFEDRIFRLSDIQYMLGEAKELVAKSLQVELETGRKGL